MLEFQSLSHGSFPSELLISLLPSVIAATLPGSVPCGLGPSGALADDGSLFSLHALQFWKMGCALQIATTVTTAASSGQFRDHITFGIHSFRFPVAARCGLRG